MNESTFSICSWWELSLQLILTTSPPVLLAASCVAWSHMFSNMVFVLSEIAVISSDCTPHAPAHFPLFYYSIYNRIENAKWGPCGKYWELDNRWRWQNSWHEWVLQFSYSISLAPRGTLHHDTYIYIKGIGTVSCSNTEDRVWSKVVYNDAW